MQEIPLQAIPNQSFSIQLDDHFYDFRFHACGNIMAVDIVRDEVPIVTGERCVPAWPLIPYSYLENGNFIFVTDDGDYPDYTQFGVTQFLVYASQSELDALNAGT